MKRLEQYHPATLFLYFALTAGISMFCMHPAVALLSLSGALSLSVVSGCVKRRQYLYYLLLFLVTAAINPLLSHNGETVLFVLNDNPVTWEAVVYGLIMGGMLTATFLWFQIFSKLMTSDKLLCLFGMVSPKAGLVFSMALRYVPLFGAQAGKISRAQKAMGFYTEERLIYRIRGAGRIFSVLVTWALENGIVTADSMSARGYGIGKRSHYSRFRITGADGRWMAVTAVLAVVTICQIVKKSIFFSCYPMLRYQEVSPAAAVTLIAYGILVFLPSAIELGDKIKWKYYASKI